MKEISDLLESPKRSYYDDKTSLQIPGHTKLVIKFKASWFPNLRLSESTYQWNLSGLHWQYLNKSVACKDEWVWALHWLVQSFARWWKSITCQQTSDSTSASSWGWKGVSGWSWKIKLVFLCLTMNSWDSDHLDCIKLLFPCTPDIDLTKASILNITNPSL